MAVISYNNSAIIPGPHVSISKRYNLAEDGTIIGSTFDITVIGKLMALHGSPTSSGTFWTQSGYPPDEIVGDTQRLASILRKQEAIRNLFATEGLKFQIQPWDGSQIVYFNPRIKGPIDFKGDGTNSVEWYEYCDYTIQLEADVVYGLYASNEDNFQYYVSRVEDDWVLDPADEIGRTYKLTHNVGATGKRFYNSSNILVNQAWQNAKNWVLPRLGIDSTIEASSGVLNFQSWGAFNYLRAERTNKFAGSYNVTETWLMYNPSGGIPAVEDFNINSKIDERGKVVCNIQGQIKGLQVSNNTTYDVISSRLQNANLYWPYVSGAMLSRAQTYSGFTLNPNAINITTDRNYFNGIINYTVEFNNRPTTMVPGASTEIITVSVDNPTDVFSKIPVFGRALGPVLQPAGTVSEKTKELTIEAIVPVATYGQPTPTQPNTDSLVISFQPNPVTQIFLTRDRITYVPNEGRYNRTTTWIYE